MAEENAFNYIIGKILKRLPQDPVIIAHYMYWLTGIILFVLMGFTFNNLYLFFSDGFKLNYLFGAMLTTVFFLMSLFSFKGARDGYMAAKNQKNLLNDAAKHINEELTPKKIEEMLNKQKNDTPTTTNKDL